MRFIIEQRTKPTNHAAGNAYEILLAKHLSHQLKDPDGDPETHWPQRHDGQSTKDLVQEHVGAFPDHYAKIEQHAKEDAMHAMGQIRHSLGMHNHVVHGGISVTHVDYPGHIAKATDLENVESPGDFVLSHPDTGKHVSISAKYGGSTSARTSTLRQIAGAIDKSGRTTAFFDWINRKKEKIGISDRIQKVARRFEARGIANAINSATSLDLKKRAVHKYTGTLRTPELTDIKISRDPGKSTPTITRPVDDMENHLNTATDISAVHTKGMTVRLYSHHGDGTKHHFASVGVKKKSGVDFSEGNVKISKRMTNVQNQ